jgi:hypothetical protein
LALSVAAWHHAALLAVGEATESVRRMDEKAWWAFGVPFR